jgi:UTP--glucose-1-phosphate uridylyltransferase
MTIGTVIIPAAGQGTRLLPATKVTAKELLPIYDRVAIDFAIDEALGAGAQRIVIVISAAKEAIRTYVGSARAEAGEAHGAGVAARRKAEIHYVIQDQALGLGHAVLCCRKAVTPGPFAVILPDDVIMGRNCLSDMAAHYTDGQMIAAMHVAEHDASKYGIFSLSGPTNTPCIPVSGMVEKPAPGTAPSSFAAVGRYILDPMIFEVLEHTPLGKGGELQLTDAIATATRALPAYAFQFDGNRYDCGNHDGLLAASVARQAIVRGKARPLAASVVAPAAVCASASATVRGKITTPDLAARPVENVVSPY